MARSEEPTAATPNEAVDAKANLDALLKLGAALQHAKLAKKQEAVTTDAVKANNLEVDHATEAGGEGEGEGKGKEEEKDEDIQIEASNAETETRPLVLPPLDMACRAVIWMLESCLTVSAAAASTVGTVGAIQLGTLFYNCHTELKFDLLMLLCSWTQMLSADSNSKPASAPALITEGAGWSKFIKKGLWDILRNRLLTSSIRDNSFILISQMLTLFGHSWFAGDNSFVVFVLSLSAVEIKLLLDDGERLILNPGQYEMPSATKVTSDPKGAIGRILNITPQMFSIVESYINLLIHSMDDDGEEGKPSTTLTTDNMVDISKSLGDIMFLVLEFIDAGGVMLSSPSRAVVDGVATIGEGDALALLLSAMRLLGAWLAEETDALHKELLSCIGNILSVVKAMHTFNLSVGLAGPDNGPLRGSYGGLEFLIAGLSHLTTEKKFCKGFVAAGGVTLCADYLHTVAAIAPNRGNSNSYNNSVDLLCSIFLNLLTVMDTRGLSLSAEEAGTESLLLDLMKLAKDASKVLVTSASTFLHLLSLIGMIIRDFSEKNSSSPVTQFIKMHSNLLVDLFAGLINFASASRGFSVDVAGDNDDLIVLSISNLSHVVLAFPTLGKSLSHDDRITMALLHMASSGSHGPDTEMGVPEACQQLLISLSP